jgi:hypothetical protein
MATTSPPPSAQATKDAPSKKKIPPPTGPSQANKVKLQESTAHSAILTPPKHKGMSTKKMILIGVLVSVAILVIIIIILAVIANKSAETACGGSFAGSSGSFHTSSGSFGQLSHSLTSSGKVLTKGLAVRERLKVVTEMAETSHHDGLADPAQFEMAQEAMRWKSVY